MSANNDKLRDKGFDLSKPRITLGKSNNDQLNKEAMALVKEVKKEIKTWEKFISSSKEG